MMTNVHLADIIALNHTNVATRRDHLDVTNQDIQRRAQQRQQQPQPQWLQ